MPKLLIADRDSTERTGIKWFVASHQLPFSQVDEAATVEQLIDYIEAQCPDVVMLELEMIPDGALAQVTHLLKTYVRRVICLTTEPVFERALQVIERRYGEPDLTLEAVAREVERSPGYLSTLFVQRKGQTFRQLLTGLRMEKARRLLAETDLPVREVSERVGYGDPNYFSRAFKQHVGLSPRVFRQQHFSSKEPQSGS
ncbi:hypothetical protein GCM10010965_16480 [Caldalkalibacillus thermarum]|uniref:helix-turn-helix transcriptional regulator n=1 Tax=Caldalkalibacillus thermarum TaxID=296745 RepID=UPI001665D5A1|nr:DNA-binding response regulator [Caldalkalibacillus thermarum]GGK24410.1 hypothetical protein GCM10010965_16480 [Caldalkalibacillus thermarum]